MTNLLKRQRDIFDGFFDEFRFSPFFSNESIMRTDIKETESNYLLDIELPSFDKKDIKVEITDGYLNVEATKKEEKDEKNKDGKIIRQERHYGTLKRSYYVGNVDINDVKGKFEQGILKIEVPKEQKVIEKKKYLELE